MLDNYRALRALKEDVEQWKRQRAWAEAGSDPRSRERYTWSMWEAAAADLRQRIAAVAGEADGEPYFAPFREAEKAASEAGAALTRKAEDVANDAKELAEEALEDLGDAAKKGLPSFEFPWFKATLALGGLVLLVGGGAVLVGQIRRAVEG